MSAFSHLKLVKSSTWAMEASTMAAQPTKPVVAKRLAKTVSGGGTEGGSVCGLEVVLRGFGLLGSCWGGDWAGGGVSCSFFWSTEGGMMPSRGGDALLAVKGPVEVVPLLPVDLSPSLFAFKGQSLWDGVSLLAVIGNGDE